MREENKWHHERSKFSAPLTPAQLAFLDDIRAVCVKHSMTIGHQDGQGAFELHGFDESNLHWLYNADPVPT